VANKILSVSICEDKIDILRLEQGVTKNYTAIKPPEFDIDQQTLEKAARWADQILINADFPSAQYPWDVFPKVNTRILKQLLTRKATQRLETRKGARVAFKDQGDITVDGIVKREVSYIAVAEDDVVDWEENIFARYKKKIQRITSLPVALCSAVVQSERPENDFMVTWVGEMSTIFVISSPQGDVKVARNIPVGLDHDDITEDADDVLESFVREFDRDIMTTLLLYNDTFEEPSCENFYLFGNEKLATVLKKFPLSTPGDHVLYHLEHLPVHGQKGNDQKTYHLTGNLFVPRYYNLVSSAIIWEQRFNKGYAYAVGLLLTGIVTSVIWMLLTTPAGRGKYKQEYFEKRAELTKINDKLFDLQGREMELKRFSGWKDFYKNTYTNQPAWSRMFSSLAQCIPHEFVINRLIISPGNRTGIHEWRCFLEGHIRTAHWNDGLALLRKFGAAMNHSPYFKIIDVQYTPLDDDKKEGSGENAFNFVIKMKLTPKENETNAD